MSKINFLCTSCRRELCDDCKEIADEYAELLTLKNRALSTAEYKIGELEKQLEQSNRRAKMYEELSKMGMPEIILKWMDEQAVKALNP